MTSKQLLGKCFVLTLATSCDIVRSYLVKRGTLELCCSSGVPVLVASCQFFQKYAVEERQEVGPFLLTQRPLSKISS
eukprot:1290882-Amphidinium_carterae.2